MRVLPTSPNPYVIHRNPIATGEPFARPRQRVATPTLRRPTPPKPKSTQLRPLRQPIRTKVHVIPSDDPSVANLGFAKLDLDRMSRTGDPETVYGASKSADQIIEILNRLRKEHPHRAVMATRLETEKLDQIMEALDDAQVIRDDTARALVVGPVPEPTGTVGVICAGTSDLPVATEAALTVQVHGSAATVISDVGVAGIHRILSVRDQLSDFDCLIVVAGMEGALPSVVGGLSGTPLVAVPTSVGYGTSFGGISALLGMLNSCAPGVVVVNIDNGYGAGVHAARVARATTPQ